MYQKKIADGANFADLIAEYGTDPGMQTEERRAKGYEIHANSSSYEANFHKAAMALEKVGDISEPVLGQSGVHIIQYLKDVPAGAGQPARPQYERTCGVRKDCGSPAFSDGAVPGEGQRQERLPDHRLRLSAG